MQVLLIDDDALFGEAWRSFAQSWQAPPPGGRLHVSVCASVAQAMVHLHKTSVDVILLDVALAEGQNGLDAIGALQGCSQAAIVVHSVRHDHQVVVQAMRAGAHDYLPKHLGLQAACQALWQIATERAHLPAPAPSKRECCDEGPAMRELARQVQSAQGSRGNVLVLGESGSGKERVARAFAQPGRPFVAIDASTLEEGLAASMLFGAVRGAFTGADRDRPGLIEEADGGVLFLDEIGNLSLSVQAKLLRVLQEQESMRLGSHVRRPVRIRVVAATHVDLAAACQAGLFRYDLYTRLAVFVLQVPPLRQRLEAVGGLFATFLAQAGEGECAISASLVRALRERPWWGNVRELEHAAYVARARAGRAAITPDHLPVALPPPQAAAAAVGAMPVANQDTERPFAAFMRQQERQALLEAYQAADGNISRMARHLGLDRSRLHVKLRQYGIHASRGR